MDTCKFSWCSRVFICCVGVARWNTVVTSGSWICFEDGLVFGDLGETCPLVFLKTKQNTHPLKTNNQTAKTPNKTKNPQTNNKENEAKSGTSTRDTTKRKKKKKKGKNPTPPGMWDSGAASTAATSPGSPRVLCPHAARSCAPAPTAGAGAPCPRWSPRRALPGARPAASPCREVGLYHGALAGKGEARTVRTPAVRTAARPAAQPARGKKQK